MPGELLVVLGVAAVLGGCGRHLEEAFAASGEGWDALLFGVDAEEAVGATSRLSEA
jgi:hypothetical protein